MKRLVVPLLISLLLAPAAHAQPLNGVVQLYDSTLIYPLPDWVDISTGKPPLSQMKFSRKQTPKRFLLEMTPVDETPEEWKNLYAFIGVPNYSGNIASHEAEVLAGLEQGCASEQMKVQKESLGVARSLLLVSCGAYKKTPGQGEIGLFLLQHRGATAVQLYREWKGPAFDATDVSKWPVTAARLREISQKLISSRLVPLQ